MIRIYLLGTVAVEMDGEIVRGFHSRKEIALLCYLAARRQRVTREHLVGLFWGEESDSKARTNLSRALYNIAQILPGCLEHDRQSITFPGSAPTWIDAAECIEQQSMGTPHALAIAADLYRGDFMVELYLDNCPEFELWLLQEREIWRQRAVQIFDSLIAYHERVGEYVSALNFANRMLTLEPWREETHRQTMRLLALSGQRTAALKQFEMAARILEQELGAEPTAETLALVERIRTDELKPTSATSLTQQSNEIQRPALPTLPNKIVGREVELAQLVQDLMQPQCRLLTIVGPGGSGKTQLALLTAHALQNNFQHGVAFVSLVATISHQQVIGAIADGLQLTFQSAQLTEHVLLDYLRERHLLLILDNFEHQMEEAALVGAILENAPEVTMLVTSRERLNLSSEQLHSLNGIQFPEENTPSSEIARYSAVQLFVQSAQRQLRDFLLDENNAPHIAQIVRSLEGLPLAIELAAAWVRAVPSKTIAEEIAQNHDFLTAPYRNFPQRHRSMRAVFDYSWQLATPTEQQALRRLAIFPATFGREAAQQITGVSLGDLLSLIDKSLLQSADQGRFRWHPLLRQYAHEHLGAEESTLLWQQYTTYYLGLLNRWAQDIARGQQKQILQEIETELDNLQQIFQSLDWKGEIIGSEMAFNTLLMFYRIRGRLEEFVEASGNALARVGDESQPNVPIAYWQLVAFRGGGLVNLSAYDLAEEHFRRAIDHLEGEKSSWVLGYCRQYQGVLGVHRGNFEGSLIHYEAAREIYEAFGQKKHLAEVLNSLGVVNNDLGNYEEAIHYLSRSIVLNQETGDDAGLVFTLSNRAASAYNQSKYLESRNYLEKGLSVARDIQFTPGILLCLAGLADTANSLQEYENALTYGKEALALTLQTRDPRQAIWARTALGMAELGLHEADAAHEHFCRGIAAGIAIKVAPRTLEAMVGLAHWQFEMEAYQEATELLGFCIHHPNLQRKVRNRANKVLEKIALQLEKHEVEMALARGRAKSIDEVGSELLKQYNLSHMPPLVVGSKTVW